MCTIQQIFGCMTFNDDVMQEYLSEDAYQAVKCTMDSGKRLDETVANTVANAMKDWAVNNNATHFTHWFQPMTGKTAEKHDSFIMPAEGGKVILEFSGTDLIKGEPDASSLPSGGLRYTADSRGYTSWDPTSYAFIKDKILYIPATFCSYTEEALDKKTPLLRSIEAVNKQAIRVLNSMGDTKTTMVKAALGPEQEYFLIDLNYYNARKDLILCGRTLFGALPPKMQELDDHYFSPLKTRVSDFMKELNEELWKLGIMAKTEHAETAPAQFEMASVYNTVNIAADHNQLVMELMPKIAEKHGLACLLHEKPFSGINGSGKHNNWSLVTNEGKNLFEPGENPEENLNFLVFATAFLEAVDNHQDLVRMVAASAGNDRRLGAAEAPPAIVSIHLGEDISTILENIANEKKAEVSEKTMMKFGIDTALNFFKDPTDRNRTSPIAFTGNKFEFRMVGSSFSVSGPNIVLNTIMADALSNFADELEKGIDVYDLLKSKISKHKRIVFNGNGYSKEWVAEAEKRGLLNLKTTPDALPYFVHNKNLNLFKKYEIFSESEATARYEIWVDNYIKTIQIEAATLMQMAVKNILPAVSAYQKDLAKSIIAQKELNISADAQKFFLEKITGYNNLLYKQIEELEKETSSVKAVAKPLQKAECIRDNVLTTMQKLRDTIDELELVVAEDYWPYPTYTDMLFTL